MSDSMLGALVPVEMPSGAWTMFAVSGASATRGCVGTAYFSVGLEDDPILTVIDWDLRPIPAELPGYIPDVFARIAALRGRCKVVRGDGVALLAEPVGLGKVVLLEAQKFDFPVSEISEELSKLELYDRAAAASAFVYAGKVQIAQAPFEKIANFRGTSANHLLRQIAEYTVDQRADSAELLTAWCTGILLALETGR